MALGGKEVSTMDRRDFYKQLLEQYTMDDEKIRRNAKRHESSVARVLNSKWLPLVSAAAVFVAVFSGYMILIPNESGKTPVPYQTVAPASANKQERISAVEMRYKVFDFSAKDADIYISFASPLSYSDIDYLLGLISDTGDVKIVKLFDSEKGELIATEQALSEATYSGAKVLAPESMLPELQKDNNIILAEFASDTLDDENFRPLTEDDLIGIQVNAPITIETTAPPKETTAPPTTSDAETTIPSDEDTSSSGTSSGSETTIAQETESPSSGVTEMTLISLPIENALSAKFINDDHIIILSDNAVNLYRIVEYPIRDFELIASYTGQNPEIRYTNNDECAYTITAEDIYGKRTLLFVANGIDSTLTAIPLGLVDSSIGYAYYQNGNLFIKTKSLDYETFYLARPNDFGEYTVDKIRDFEVTATILSVYDDSFVYALMDDTETSLYDYNFVTKMTTPLNFSQYGRSKFIRSADLTNFAMVNGEDTWVYNSETKLFITTEADGSSLAFNQGDTRFFSDSEQCYFIQGVEIYLANSAEQPYANGFENASSLYGIYGITDSDVKLQVYN